VVLAVVFALAGPWIIDLMTTAPDVRLEARHFLIWVVAAPVIGVFAWIYDGIFIGATLTAQMRRTMLLSACVYALALAVLVPVFGNHGLWAALMVFFAARGVTMWRAYPALATRIGSAPQQTERL
jgi:MATE family multidrug resistance protein